MTDTSTEVVDTAADEKPAKPARPSSSLVAEVTTVMSMPRERSILSWSISWNMTCSVRPKV